ncbi:hypothetical protein [Halomonas sp. A020]|nr:hypothetical protein [Halomonas sp. A020]
MSQDVLSEQQRYLAQLLEAIQRCAWFLHQSRKKSHGLWTVIG